jgi:hypothetical protein
VAFSENAQMAKAPAISLRLVYQKISQKHHFFLVSGDFFAVVLVFF